MSKKPIRIGAHARFEMKRRRIRPREIVLTIRKPGQVLPSAKGRQIFQALVGLSKRLLLRVIVKESPAAYHVITVYKTSKITKYWSTP